ncbi:trihelix transcription factor ASIL2-like [Forsythia ovata]|uniref:Trihelix transcription factor ASIL2-like n=1 Tax=Forsythia ovata TaxID=205694 RepID=A0ABD1W5F2_9LAMI
MATIFSPSSPSANDDNIPTTTLALPSIAIAAASASRCIPPPCWSTNETVTSATSIGRKWPTTFLIDVPLTLPRRPPNAVTRWKNSASAIALRSSVLPHLVAPVDSHSPRSTSNACTPWKRAPTQSPPSSDDKMSEDDHKNNIKGINDLYNNNSYNNQKVSSGNQGPVSNGTTTSFHIRIPC